MAILEEENTEGSAAQKEVVNIPHDLVISLVIETLN